MCSVSRPTAQTVHPGYSEKRLPTRYSRAGFTLIELVIVMAILGILMVIGVPAMSIWVTNARLNSMADFYLDGLRLARNGAVQKSAASRFVLTANANGQYDWEVDWCFPTTAQPCDNVGMARWSTATAAAQNDPNAANPSLSVVRSADSLPPATKVSTTLAPVNALAIYFNSYGWVNTNVQPHTTNLCFDVDGSCATLPTAAPDVRPTAVAINLSGMAERCDPLVAATDSRACSP